VVVSTPGPKGELTKWNVISNICYFLFLDKKKVTKEKSRLEMVRSSAKTVAPIWQVLQAPVLVEVGISGLFFFGSFLLEEQKK